MKALYFLLACLLAISSTVSAGDETDCTRYIVIFNKDVAAEVIDNAVANVETAGGTVGHRYNSSLKGFSCCIPESLYSIFNDDPSISYVEKDSIGKKSFCDHVSVCVLEKMVRLMEQAVLFRGEYRYGYEGWSFFFFWMTAQLV
ncbi:hypothetical protein BC936DRAFT_137980 [Jimgerdemannia flammicorona]|uniref:Inhibitor I9 domain-containing protein n=1 Tax=Jimgerdemannia flammicorona TaxID=994334 RepID=A0A433CW42_9FUNG|nr:hypothetical protein BC936DRAFT_137980 [Jimgerdemannia flammicorona]